MKRLIRWVFGPMFEFAYQRHCTQQECEARERRFEHTLFVLSKKGGLAFAELLALSLCRNKSELHGFLNESWEGGLIELYLSPAGMYRYRTTQAGIDHLSRGAYGSCLTQARHPAFLE